MSILAEVAARGPRRVCMRRQIASTCLLQRAAHCCACDLQLRKQLDLHVNLVHGFSMSGLPTRHKDVDIVVIRSALPSMHHHSLRHALFHMRLDFVLPRQSRWCSQCQCCVRCTNAAGHSTSVSQEWVDATEISSKVLVLP